MQTGKIMYHIICGECDSDQGTRYSKGELDQFLENCPLDEQHCSHGFCRAILYDARCEECENNGECEICQNGGG